MEQSFRVTGLHCQACVQKIEAGLKPVSATAHVDLPSSTLRVTDATVSLVELRRIVAGLGSYDLKPVDEAAPAMRPGIAAYYPLILIGLYLGIGSLVNTATLAGWMQHFMAGFFLVFSFFKLLNLEGFATGYASYDLIAGKVPAYGKLYPFIELALSLCFLFGWQIEAALWATLIVTVLSGIGVLRSLRRKQAISCACLGTLLNVPLSTVTLVEDFGMAVMALAMLMGVV